VRMRASTCARRSDSVRVKTARFTDLVKTGGKPEPYTLWGDPGEDATLQSALKQGRVLSVHQEIVGTKADFGTVGYEGGKQTQVLLFPRKIERFAGRKIVGVKYELLDAPENAPKAKGKAEAKRTGAARKKPAAAPKPAPKAKETARAKPAREKGELERNDLVKGIRSAMKLLDAGKTVAAYRKLEQLTK
jgi:hypothetical protein